MNVPVSAPDLFSPRHNLLTSANLVDTGSGDWENGVQFSPKGCFILDGQEIDPCSGDQKSEAQECAEVLFFKPYLVEMGLDWNALSEDDPKAIAMEHLELGTSSMLENFIWNGIGGGSNPVLGTGGTDVSPTTPTPLGAIGAVEAAFLDPTNSIGAGGTLYMSPAVAVYAQAIIEEDGAGILRTKTTGAKVIVGAFPVDKVAGHTGDVDLYLGGIFMQETRDAYRSNEHDLRVERLAVVAWNDCAKFTADTE